MLVQKKSLIYFCAGHVCKLICKKNTGCPAFIMIILF
jgi:hypothetical protein